MNKIKILLDIEKDIKVLEEFGEYKSAKILHGKFVRLAQMPNMQNSVVDTNATPEQNKAFNDYVDVIKERKSQNRLPEIRDYADSLSSARYDRVSEVQQKYLLAYARQLLNSNSNSPIPDIKSVTPVAKLNLLESKPTSKPTSNRQDDISKQFNPFSREDNRPVKYYQYGDGSYTEIRTNPDYTEDRLFVDKDGFRKRYKDVPPETKLVNYQSSPGNWTTGVIPVGMDPKMADPNYSALMRGKNWENSSGYNEFIANNPKATPSQIRDFIENGGLISSEGSTATPSTNPSSNGPAGAISNNGRYKDLPPKPSVTDSSGNAITTTSGSPVVTSSKRKKKFIKIAQETAPVSSNDTNSNATTTPTATQINSSPTSSSSNSSSENNSEVPQKITYSADTYGQLANSVASISIRQNMSLSEALNKLVALGIYFNGKPLGTHVNFDKLKQAVSSIPQVTKKTLGPTHKQRGFIFLYALTNYVLDENLLRYLNPPEGYEFPEEMKGKPLPLSIYERVGLYRSTYPQERMFIFQKIRQQDPNSGFTGNGILPRIR